MAIIWIEGFDLYNSTNLPTGRRWPTLLNSTLVTGRFAGQAFSGSFGAGSGFNYLMALGTTYANLAIGAAIQLSAGPISAKTPFFRFMNGTNVECTLSANPDGSITWDGLSGATASSIGSIALVGVWNYFEVELVRSATVGTVKVYCNGSMIISATNVNTGTADYDTVAPVNALIGTTTLFLFDDMYTVDAATRLGECRIDTLHPTADTATKDWTPNSGSNNFSRVADSATTGCDGDTTYNSTLTVGNKDLFDMTDLPSAPNSVFAVQAILVARKDNAALAEVCVDMKSGATSVQGGTDTLSGSYTWHGDLYTTDPNTSAAWTGAAVNALQLGYERLS